jgi:predicted nucleic acid-binding protein
MRILADTNAFLAVALDEPEKSWLLQATKAVELAAPAVLPYEVGNALSALVKRKRLGADEAAEAWQVIQSIPVELVEVDISASLLVAAEHGIYAYDAYFLQCAMRLKCPLLTLDRAMASVARAMRIKLVEKP